MNFTKLADNISNFMLKRVQNPFQVGKSKDFSTGLENILKSNIAFQEDTVITTESLLNYFRSEILENGGFEVSDNGFSYLKYLDNAILLDRRNNEVYHLNDTDTYKLQFKEVSKEFPFEIQANQILCNTLAEYVESMKKLSSNEVSDFFGHKLSEEAIKIYDIVRKNHPLIYSNTLFALRRQMEYKEKGLLGELFDNHYEYEPFVLE